MMLKTIHIAFFVLIQFISFAEGINFRTFSYEDAIIASKSEGKPLFIDFYTTWCGPCKVLSSEVFTNKELGDYINDNYISLKIDAEQMPEIAKKYGVSAYPTMIITHPALDINIRLVGVQTAAQILSVAKSSRNPASNRLHQVREIYNKGKRDEALVAEYIQLLKINNSPYQQIAKLFVEGKEFKWENEKSLMIMREAELDRSHLQMVELIKRFNGDNQMHREIFIGLALREYEMAFKSRNIKKLDDFILKYMNVFDLLLKSKNDLTSVRNYLDSLYKVRID